MNNEAQPTPARSGEENRQTALFLSLVMQQANMALMFLGKTPHPETGKATMDIDAAGLFIDTLEMLAAKTKGNLTKPEHDLLQQNLTALRLAFVQTVDAAPAAPSAPPKPEAHPSPGPEPAAPPTPSPEATPGDTPASVDDARKKFVKKY